MKSLNHSINKKQIFIWILSAFPVLLTAIVYRALPAQIPTNWGIDKTVTYGDKSTIWLIAGMSPFLGTLFYFLPAIDPKKRNYINFMDAYQSFQLFMQLFLLVITGIIVVESFRPGTIKVSTVVCAMCGLLFVMMGNMMPKIQQNYFCGFKTPWTLSSEAVWNKTHRMGGKLFLAAGLIGFLGAFLPEDRWKMFGLLIPVIAAVTVPCVMSYVWFRREQRAL